MIGQEQVRLRASPQPKQGWRPRTLLRYRGSSLIVFGTTDDAEGDACIPPFMEEEDRT